MRSATFARIACAGIFFQAVMLQAAYAVEGATLVSKDNVVQVAKPNGAWSPASAGQALAIHDRLRTGEDSRATVRMADASMLRLDELTTIEILPAKEAGASSTLNIKQGSTYFFSRESTHEVRFETPAANGAIRGTEFLLTVSAELRTLVAMLSGEFELSNGGGNSVLKKGDQGEAEGGQQSKTSIRDATNSVQWYLLIEKKLPPHKTVMTATKSEFLNGICDSMREWRDVAPQTAKAAVSKRRELARDILVTAIHCLGDCGAIADVVAAIVAVDPEEASSLTELAVATAPSCADAIQRAVGRGEGEGNFGNPPININMPPGSVGGGAGGNVCIVCHNGQEVQVACSDLNNYLKNHPGDTAGPCQPTPVTNP